MSNDLQAIIEQASARRELAGLDALVDELLQRHGSHIHSILLYGSCLRNGDLSDGLADLYLIVESYRGFYRKSIQAIANWLLPPNVFYLEIPYEGQTMRAKYAVLSQRDFSNGCSRRWFHSYIWGRFTQPLMLAYYRDEQTKQITIGNLARAICTFIERVLPRIPTSGSIRDLWSQGLRLSYNAELRTETGNRADELVELRLDHYAAVTEAAALRLKYPLEIIRAEKDGQYRSTISPARRLVGRIGWRIRIIQGKLLSVLRLLKALFTFDGGLDYIAWKLERHSGQTIEIPDRVRRYPLIFIWGLFWTWRRRGIFR